MLAAANIAVQFPLKRGWVAVCLCISWGRGISTQHSLIFSPSQLSDSTSSAGADKVVQEEQENGPGKVQDIIMQGLPARV